MPGKERKMSKKEIGKVAKNAAFDKLAESLQELTKQGVVSWRLVADEYVADLTIHVNEMDATEGETEREVFVIGVEDQNGDSNPEKLARGISDTPAITTLHNFLLERYS